jgi:putative ABC transport system permease protein
LPMAWVRISSVNFATFSETVVSFEPTWASMATSLALATALGLLGGLLPALEAARTSPLDAARG